MALASLGRACLDALQTFFKYLPGYFRREFIWWPVVIPFLVAGAVYMLSAADVFGWNAGPENKDLMEIVHPSLLATGVLLSLAGWRLTGDGALALMAGICASCLGRELGGQGTSSILIVGLFTCIWWANTHRQAVTTFLVSTWVRSLVAMCFISYTGSQLLDRGVIKRIGRLFTGDWEWKPLYSSNMEECLEVLGGLFLLLAAVLLLGVARRALRR